MASRPPAEAPIAMIGMDTVNLRPLDKAWQLGNRFGLAEVARSAPLWR